MANYFLRIHYSNNKVRNVPLTRLVAVPAESGVHVNRYYQSSQPKYTSLPKSKGWTGADNGGYAWKTGTKASAYAVKFGADGQIKHLLGVVTKTVDLWVDSWANANAGLALANSVYLTNIPTPPQNNFLTTQGLA